MIFFLSIDQEIVDKMAQAQVEYSKETKVFGEYVTARCEGGKLTFLWNGKRVSPPSLQIQSLPLGHSIPSSFPGWLILRTVGKTYNE